MNRNGLWVCKCTHVAQGNVFALLFKANTATLEQERRKSVTIILLSMIRKSPQKMEDRSKQIQTLMEVLLARKVRAAISYTSLRISKAVTGGGEDLHYEQLHTLCSNCTDHIPSSEVYIHSFGQEIPRILRNPKIQ
jgi:hypothetical protein